MIAEYSPSVGRRIASVLFVTQSLASAGLIAAFTVNAIVGARLSGNDALSGLPGMWLQIGGAAMAYPAGRFMQRFGRRPGLSLGFLLGSLGMVLSGTAVVQSSFALFLLGLTFLGASRGVIDQSRYAAADAQLPEQRARAISMVVFASTVGAVGGPALVAPLGDLVASFGIDRLAGPMFGGAALIAVGALVMATMLRPDPRDIARAIAAAQPEAHRHLAEGVARPLAEIIRLPAVQLAVTAMIFGQGVMVLVMGVTSLHMSHHNHGLGDISLVFAAHTLGMFGMSFVTGFVTDRFGRATTIALGALMLVCGSLLAPVSLMTPWIALALFVVGLGWNMCYIGGSSLLADSLAPAERGQYQGLSDLTVNATAALSSISSGLVLAAFGYGLLCALGAALAVLPLALIGLHGLRQQAAAPRSA